MLLNYLPRIFSKPVLPVSTECRQSEEQTGGEYYRYRRHSGFVGQ